MEIKQKDTAAPTSTQAALAVRHAEPQAGGSYTRNPTTGALDRTAPAPAATQPDQE